MSFTLDLKEELVTVVPREKHCRIAELAALFSFIAEVRTEPRNRVVLSVDNEAAVRKCFTLLNKAFNIETCIFEKMIETFAEPIVLTDDNAKISTVLECLHLSDPISILTKDCCKRAYLRGVFIATGFVFEPSKSYQLEMVLDKPEYARLVTKLLQDFDVTSKQMLRKKHNVIYVKGVDPIADTLNVLGAYKAIMTVANTRIMKDVRNDVNRRNNCDTANIIRASIAGSKQIEDILLIKEKVGLNALPDNLRDIANIRLEHPDSSLTELGEFLNPPVGKSGVNHRLRKLSEYADSLR